MLTIIAAFTKTVGVPATGLTLAEINLYLTAIAKATGVATVIWDGSQHPTVEIASLGMYQRQYSTEDQTVYEYVAGAHYTGATELDSDWITVAASGGGVADILVDTNELQTDWVNGGRLDALIDAIKAKTDLITTGTALTVVSAIVGSTLSITIAATYDATVSGLTIPSTWTAVYFTLKDDTSYTDTAALVQILASNPAVPATDGLQRLNGAAATAAQGTLTVTQVAGTVRIVITDNATAQLAKASNLTYDLKVITSTGTSSVMTSGTASIALTPTKTI